MSNKRRARAATEVAKQGSNLKLKDKPPPTSTISRKSLGDYNRSHHHAAMRIANDQARADPSDPFTFNRVASLLLGGFCMISDYRVQFRKEERTTESGDPFVIEVPYNIQRP